MSIAIGNTTPKSKAHLWVPRAAVYPWLASGTPSKHAPGGETGRRVRGVLEGSEGCMVISSFCTLALIESPVWLHRSWYEMGADELTTGIAMRFTVLPETVPPPSCMAVSGCSAHEYWPACSTKDQRNEWVRTFHQTYTGN